MSMKLLPIAPEASTGLDHGSTMKWQRILGEPLLLFVVIGAVLFGAYRLLTPASEEHVDQQRIDLTKDDVRQLAVTWLAQGRPPPTADEMRSLMDQKVTEEILFREAVSLGLDRDDEIIKRRLAQKMDFLAADLATLDEPNNAQLKEWYSKRSDRFALSPHLSFRHLYFSFDKHGEATRETAAAAIALVSGKSEDSPAVASVADPFMFRNYYGDATPEQMAKEFGPDFARALFDLKPRSWQGPVQSGYGWHLIWVDSIEPGRVPAFEEVAPAVKSAWLDERYAEVKSNALKEMRSRYVVNLPTMTADDLQDLQFPKRASAQIELSAQ
ncbi:peptidyl-prolyl cis-trans isomerase [Rhizobium johnstonii]|uniref:peptidylprolyl isomerase n=1 Tax=Rhizobium TaxID=379 RepID=UPI0010317AD1|nr:peptidylprolyl isomerase [Rhizobium leguminosarum]NEI59549.1 peptidyl-prolyl cis-trans isomerase [Rhizobium leguminosarum]NEI88389.1 peptidyl-prolyl cis-trans isomerase [Rhizobium leguminosarum]TBF89241.1 peptidyl-prolyl cis-trans isomerase [Rhizobium leguminosarum]TBG55830.1 peptidyl-prolyl cis-trans isomerase [Rhizobium leguminosarum]